MWTDWPNQLNVHFAILSSKNVQTCVKKLYRTESFVAERRSCCSAVRLWCNIPPVHYLYALVLTFPPRVQPTVFHHSSDSRKCAELHKRSGETEFKWLPYIIARRWKRRAYHLAGACSIHALTMRRWASEEQRRGKIPLAKQKINKFCGGEAADGIS